jgi:hypothetical protein
MIRVDIFQPKTNIYMRLLARRKVDKLMRRIVPEAKKRALEYTGNSIPTPRGGVARSIDFLVTDSPGGVTGTLYATHPKAALVHDGAPEHPISPRRAGGLLFYWPQRGRFVCIKGTVAHPGFKGKRFLTEPLYQSGTAMGWAVSYTKLAGQVGR